MRSTLALKLALVLAGAALLALLGRGTTAVGHELDMLADRQGRLDLVATATAVDFGPADTVAERLIGAGDDIEFREALGLVERSRQFSHLPVEVIKLHGQAVALLAPLVETGDAVRASRAATLIGTLYAEGMLVDPGAAGRYGEQAVEAFQQAARLDPTNEHAKLGLELIYRRPAEIRAGQPESRSGGVTGAATLEPGTGY